MSVACKRALPAASTWVLAAMLACLACDRLDTSYRGTELTPALPKRDFTLTATDGRAFAFPAETRGRLALLFFGYTHCPDVCPIHMANIAAALRTLPAEDRARVRVVFVTTDPARDTPAHLRAWLDAFDPGFIGLRGDADEVNRIEGLFGLAPSVREPAGSDADTVSYGVGHAARVLAFTSDDSLRVLYPFGIDKEDWASDLPKLLAVGARR